MKLNFAKGAMAVPTDAILLNGAGETELRALLILASADRFRDAYDENAEEAAALCGCDRSRFDSACAFWRGAGLLLSDKQTAAAEKKPKTALLRSELPQYGGKELAALMEDEGSGLKTLIDSCQNLLGKVFNPTEVGKIAAMSEHLGLEDEYILLMVRHCVKNGKNSVAYVERKTYGMYNEGIDTYEKLDAYIKAKEKYAPVVRKLRDLLGMGEREPSKKENGFFKLWTQEWDLPFELMEKAYGIAVDRGVKTVVPYMGKILNDWHEKGFTTEAEIDGKEAEFREAKQNGGSSFDTGDFFEAALKRSYADTASAADALSEHGEKKQ